MNELESKISAIVQAHGCELYDITTPKENGHQIFRVCITKAHHKRISFDDCQAISEVISPLLDVFNPFEHEYFLEVSSPGLQRTLKTLQHFKGAIGEVVSLKLKDKSHIEGIIQSCSDEKLEIQLTKDKSHVHVFLADIHKAMTVFKF